MPQREATQKGPDSAVAARNGPLGSQGTGAKSPSRRSIGAIAEELGLLNLQVLVAPRGLDVDVGEPVLFDPLDESIAQPGELVLGVGLDPAAPACRRALRQIAAAGATAVILKFAEAPRAELTREAEEVGLSLLAAPTHVSWGQLFTLLRTSLSASAAGDGSGEMAPIGDLFALANAVAAMVGGATTIEDPRSQVLAYSSLGHPTDAPRREAILGRQVPAEWLQRLEQAGTFRRLWQGDEPVEVPAIAELGMRRRLAVAVRTAGEIIGSIWVVEGDEVFGPEAKAALREAARMAAIHLLRHRSSEDIERRRKADALRSLLEGRGGIRQHAEVLGLDLDTPVVVIALAQPPAGEAETTVRAQRAADLVAMCFEAYRRRAACAPIGGTVYALLPTAGPGGPERRRELVETVVERVAESLHMPLVGGIGRQVPGLDHVSESRRQADQAARALISDRLGRIVAEIDEVTTRVVLSELVELARNNPQLTEGRVMCLARRDEQKGTDYLGTLRAYLDSFGDIGAAAKAI
ncbi:MAG: hypothetical protein ACRDZ6_03280, partial [Acidimicrobiales bacterium]